MKLLLTSGGLENQPIINALRELIGTDFKDRVVLYVRKHGQTPRAFLLSSLVDYDIRSPRIRCTP